MGNVDVGLVNRAIIDNVSIEDREGNVLLKADRVSAKFDLRALLQGDIVINNVQLHNMHLNLAKRDSAAAPNYQFLIDAFSSDEPSSGSDLSLRINALLIRHGRITYNLASAEETPGRFNARHLALEDLRANISLKALRNDSINTTIRHLSFREHSGLTLENLAFKLVANPRHLTLSRFALQMPGTLLRLDTLEAAYDSGAREPWKTMRVRGGIGRSSVTLSDLQCFVPALASFNDPLWVQAGIQGNEKEVTLSHLQIRSDNNDVRLRLHCRVRNPFEPSRRFFDCTLPELNVTSTGFRFLTQNLGMETIHPLLTRLGYLSFQGSARGMLKDLQLQGLIRSAAGELDTNLHLGLDGQQKTFHGQLLTEGFQLGGLLAQPDLGRVSLNVEVKGQQTGSSYPALNVTGHLPLVEYKGHSYGDIHLNVNYREGYYRGFLNLEDADGSLAVSGDFNPTKTIPEFNLLASLDHLRPDRLGLTDKYPGCELSARIRTNFTGNTFDNFTGNIHVDSLHFRSPEGNYVLHHFTVSSYPNEQKEREIHIDSDFLNGEGHGHFTFADLPRGFTRMLGNYLPLFIRKNTDTKPGNNRLSFSLRLTDTEMLEKMFRVPLDVRMPATIKGYFHERNNQVKVEGYFPAFSYKGKRYESGMVLIDNPQDRLQALVRLTQQMQGNSMLNLSLKAEARDNELKTFFHWGNNTERTYSGEFATVTRFRQRDTKHDNPSARIEILPSNIIINDTTWTLRPSVIDIDSGRVVVNDFRFEHGPQHIHIDGKLTENEHDAVRVDLNDIRLEYIFDIIQFHPVDFRGFASGKAVVTQAMKSPALDADLRIRDFTFNHGYMGDMKIRGLWNAEEGDIHLDADIRDASRHARTTVQGWVSPPKAGLDLHITADSTNLEFLNMYTASVFRHLSGRVTGDIRLHGPFANLNLEGKASGNARVDVGVLNAAYDLQLDSVSLLPGSIEFRQARMTDKDGHTGQVEGTLAHDHLRNLRYRFTFDTDNMLLYNAPESEDALIYGSIYGTGITTLQGDDSSLNVNTNLRTGKNTTFVYNLGTPEEIASNEFITFVDKTPHAKWENDSIPDPFRHPVSEETDEEEDEGTSDIHINAQLDVTPDATIKVIMDPLSGDYASAQGSGNFQASYYNKGEFKLYGTYTLDHGLYKLSLQEVIRKDFLLQPGGSITFSGRPENGDINLQAVYTVNSASLKDLAPNAAFTQNTAKVNCLLNLTGKLATPNLHFDLELPNVSEEERELVKSYISTDEQMEMQIIYLLGIGRFYTYDYSNTNVDNGTQSSAMNSLLSSTLSGQLNNMLSHIINSSQWNFGTNLSTGDKGWTDMEVEGMLSGRLLNNRLLINGNFGYRDNQLANTNFVGDFDVQWLLTPSGDIRLKGYNQTNDRYFAKTTLTTQGIGLLFKRDFGHWKELFHRTLRRPVADSLRTDTVPSDKQKKKAKKRRKARRKKLSWDF